MSMQNSILLWLDLKMPTSSYKLQLTNGQAKVRSIKPLTPKPTFHEGGTASKKLNANLIPADLKKKKTSSRTLQF